MKCDGTSERSFIPGRRFYTAKDRPFARGAAAQTLASNSSFSGRAMLTPTASEESGKPAYPDVARPPGCQAAVSERPREKATRTS